MESLQRAYTRADLLYYFLGLGTTGFGGPPALVSAMHRDLVVDRQWIAEEDYREGLALAQLAPGPLAAQLAIYLGYVHYGLIGATMAGIAFVIPSFLMVLALGWVYMLYGGLPWMQAIFYGIGATVIGIIALSTYKLTQKTVANNWLSWSIFGVSALTTALLETELLWLVLLCGFVYWFVKRPSSKIQSSVVGFAPFLSQVIPIIGDSVLWQLGFFFAKAGRLSLEAAWPLSPFCMVALSKNMVG